MKIQDSIILRRNVLAGATLLMVSGFAPRPSRAEAPAEPLQLRKTKPLSAAEKKKNKKCLELFRARRKAEAALLAALRKFKNLKNKIIRLKPAAERADRDLEFRRREVKRLTKQALDEKKDGQFESAKNTERNLATAKKAFSKQIGVSAKADGKLADAITAKKAAERKFRDTKAALDKIDRQIDKNKCERF